MLNKFIFAASALLAVTLIAAPASASTHRSHRGYAAHGTPLARAGSAARIRHAGSKYRYARIPTARHGAVFAQRIYGRHHRRFVALGRRGRLIQRYVGPASTPISSGTQVGGASYYGGRHHTASGGFVGAGTCAHRTLPFGTRVLVTNLSNLRQAMLIVNDRGPFVRGRIVDVSVGAAGLLGMLHSGTARVSVQVVGGPG